MLSMNEMPYVLAIKVKIYPSNEQKRIIAVNDGAKRAVYNHLVACGNERYRLKKTAKYMPLDRERIDYLESVSFSDKGIKNAMPFLYGNDVDAQTVANAIKNYKTAWKNQKQLHTGVPVFKHKSYEQSYQTNPHYYNDKDGNLTSNVQFDGYHFITLPKLKKIRFDGSPKLVKAWVDAGFDIRIGTITISRDAVGEYWASFTLGSEKPFRKPFPKTGNMHGIDLNLIDFMNDSDGNASPNNRYYAKMSKKREKAQRKLNRRLEAAKRDNRNYYESKGYQKQRIKVAYLNRKVARQRDDYLHILSKAEVENQDFIAAEDLKVSNLVKNHKLAKAIEDAGWRSFLTKLQYKAILYGKEVVLVPPQYTTQTCSNCGYKMKGEEKLTLADREWTCPNCGTHHERDTNAAKNILNRGLELYNRTI